MVGLRTLGEFLLLLPLWGAASCAIPEAETSQSQRKIAGEVVLKTHEVRDLINVKIDHSGPKICALPFERKEFCGIEGCTVFKGEFHPMAPQQLLATVEEDVFPLGMEDGQTIATLNGLLFVRTTEKNHEAIQACLRGIRESDPGHR
ncbi:MAG: hypothetical protein ACPG31_11860 [Planctomycetota bacterium]